MCLEDSTPSKTCIHCGETKSADQFYRKPDGRLRARCAPCMRSDNQDWYGRNREKRLDVARQWEAANPEKRLEISRRFHERWPERGPLAWKKWQKANPDRCAIVREAGRLVDKAIKRGELIRPATCEECGVTGRQITAAHHDYARPLEVRWLCRSCHSRWDRHDPKTLH